MPPGGFDAVEWEQWAARGPGTAPPPPELVRAAAGAGPVPPGEVEEVYLPLCRLLAERFGGGHPPPRPARGGAVPPFVLGIAGGVAVGKSTSARVLRALLRGGHGGPTVELLGTDAFLHPNYVLAARGLLGRKGFPESYDHRSLVASLDAIRSGVSEVAVPVYSHLAYDIVPGRSHSIREPDVLIVEGLNVLQAPAGDRADGPAAVSDYLDASIYVDASEQDAGRWFRERLFALRAGSTPESGEIIRWLSTLSDVEAGAVAEATWTEVNLVNMRQHVAPTRDRAQVILEKDGRHRVVRVLVARRRPRPSRSPSPT
jgi:type I pantothenate kinase